MKKRDAPLGVCLVFVRDRFASYKRLFSAIIGRESGRFHLSTIYDHVWSQVGSSRKCGIPDILTFFLDSRQECLATPRSLSCVRLCSSDLEWYSGRTAVAVPLQSEQQKSKALEQARGRKSA